MGAEGKESLWHRACSQPQSAVSRANCLVFIGLAELSILNAHFLQTILVKEKTAFFATVPFSHNTPRSDFMEERQAMRSITH
jgi:hypothetical protein